MIAVIKYICALPFISIAFIIVWIARLFIRLAEDITDIGIFIGGLEKRK